MILFVTIYVYLSIDNMDLWGSGYALTGRASKGAFMDECERYQSDWTKPLSAHRNRRKLEPLNVDSLLTLSGEAKITADQTEEAQ